RGMERAGCFQAQVNTCQATSRSGRMEGEMRMMRSSPSALKFSRMTVCRVGLLILFLGVPGSPGLGQKPIKPDVLHIGTSGTLALDTSGRQEKSSQETLESFIKSETGFDNDIVHLKDWVELAEKMAGGQFQLGVFQGYEFAWAKEKYPKLQPLA